MAILTWFHGVFESKKGVFCVESERHSINFLVMRKFSSTLHTNEKKILSVSEFPETAWVWMAFIQTFTIDEQEKMLSKVFIFCVKLSPLDGLWCIESEKCNGNNVLRVVFFFIYRSTASSFRKFTDFVVCWQFFCHFQFYLLPLRIEIEVFCNIYSNMMITIRYIPKCVLPMIIIMLYSAYSTVTWGYFD